VGLNLRVNPLLFSSNTVRHRHYDWNVDRREVHTVPDPLLKVAREHHLAGIQRAGIQDV
jgi:hypothetical protein